MDQIKKVAMRGTVGLLVLKEKGVAIFLALRLPPLLPRLLGDPCLQCPLTTVQVPHRQMDGVQEGLELRGRKVMCGALVARVTRQGGAREVMVAQIPQWYLRERGMEAVQKQSGVLQWEV